MILIKWLKEIEKQYYWMFHDCHVNKIRNPKIKKIKTNILCIDIKHFNPLVPPTALSDSFSD